MPIAGTANMVPAISPLTISCATSSILFPAMSATRLAAIPRSRQSAVFPLAVLPSGPEEEALYVRVRRKVGRLAASTVPAVDQNVAAMGDGERLARVLLDHGDGDAVAIDRDDGGEQRLGSDRRETGGGLVEQKQRGLDHQRHRHGKNLALTTAQRARGMAAL